MVNYTFIDKRVIKRTTMIEGDVETVSPLKIGGGKDNFDPSSLAKDSILKDVEGRPIIPGSSWKGIFRSTGERILRLRNIEVCSGIGKDYCLNNNRKERDFNSALKENVDQALEIFWDYTCLNCKVFGTMSVIGAVRFLDSLPISYSLNTRSMIAISRTEGAVARRALVTVEYVDVGSKFSFKMMGYNLPNYAIGYLITIMKNIHDGFTQVGGHKSRGFGFVKFGKVKFTDLGEKRIGDEDIQVKDVGDLVEGNGDEFFGRMKPFMEAFNNAKIPYPKK
ncbi:CRISPR-associated RAMP protein [Saccharolobus solfataricus]|nr:CRISPR-associated RAMP protein Csx7 [Saccharolobus solfataricus]QPG48918.1 CRISPR-associated RAMP protein [Saccharolobus solfataricus]8BMW_H Chain H, CRISPR-associated Cas7 paralog (Type III-D) [Saccharolobus solfataricus]8BMW_I Chain I, CRISPR-associated Cas7 paralog (Type III-D) [Saccharolobus solfataricus]SAI85104.1 CRISPR-associated Cas7 paralog (Type III-D) [Saccharolobus solfataricus]